MTSQLEEHQVHSATLQGCQPFPTYNSTIAAPVQGTHGLCSILSADGELVVLQASVTHSKQDSRTLSFRVVAVLPPIEKPCTSFCQCWLQDGSVIATAHDCGVAFYSSDAFVVQRRLQVRHAVISMDMIVKKQERDSIELEHLVLVATAFGAFLYVVELGKEKNADDGSCDEKLELLAPVAAVHSGVAMCMVKFSGDGYTAAMGSVDGRLFVRTLDAHDDRVLATIGTLVFSTVLDAPRITGLCFSRCSTKLMVSTRKGSVVVYTFSTETGQWQSLPSYSDLRSILNPKAGGTHGSTITQKTATAAKTLVTCWGPVFVLCSRVIASRLAMYDCVSGSLLHSLQFAPSTPGSCCELSQWEDQHVITGICSMQIRDDGPSLLLCHDASSSIVVVAWPFLDFVAD